jgi:D-ribose pyranose/furanose isomerase RbsD
MSHRQLVEIEVPDGVILTAVQEAVTPLGVSLYLVQERDLVDAAIQREIPKVGVSWFWRRSLLLEAVLPKTHAPEPLVHLIANMLATFGSVRRLIIVDPYFFPSGSGATYPDRVELALSTVLPSLTELIVITNNRFNAAVKAAVETRIASLNAKLAIRHRQSEDFHDRFWIADETKGIFVGTSLNGIGTRYALTDYLATWDVPDIVTALKARQLI